MKSTTVDDERMKENVTTDYDKICAAEFAALQNRVDRYFVELNTECPYGLPYIACFYQAMFGPINDRAMELFLAAGYRRNGNCLYSMHCRQCSACIPIRMKPADFKPNRNQRRVRSKNADIDVCLSSVDMDKEHMALCDRFLSARYPQEFNTADGYYGGFFCNNIVDSIRIDFRIDGRLVGGSVIDMGNNWMNAVYFYFDPDESARSLGTFNILTLIDMCRDYEIEYLYLGYYIKEVRAMNYKERFCPHELFIDGVWQQKM
ncbi:arginyltransferase [Desulfosediminicola flagellatus]|uniref:arginyltransferase n=1 Tax=Desulfosediminicola flagellatus TaxID=2569541 RepID=UPI001E547C34|nr:arginyltransferase [Desulfosediminicola flagellatus]